jgi:hypothetical protein
VNETASRAARHEERVSSLHTYLALVTLFEGSPLSLAINRMSLLSDVFIFFGRHREPFNRGFDRTPYCRSVSSLQSSYQPSTMGHNDCSTATPESNPAYRSLLQCPTVPVIFGLPTSSCPSYTTWTPEPTPSLYIEPKESTPSEPTDRPMVPTCAADWEAKKDIIRELYMEKNMVLNEVIAIMQEKHKFKAT